MNGSFLLYVPSINVEIARTRTRTHTTLNQTVLPRSENANYYTEKYNTENYSCRSNKFGQNREI